MARIERFEDLKAWQEARKLVVDVFRLTRSKPVANYRSISDQLERASLSVMTNIAEGFERPTNADKIRLLSIARASAGEVRSLLYVIEDLLLADKEKVIELRNLCQSVGKLISGLIKVLRK